MPKKKQVFEPENLESIRSAISGLIVEPPETIEPVVYSVDLLSRHDPYYPMVQGEATSRLAMTATRNMAINPITGDAVIEDEGFRAFFEGYDGLKIGLTVGAQKLLSTAALYLTQNNHYRPEESARIETEVQIPLISYARLLGYPVDERETATPEEAEKEKRRIKNLMKDVRGKINDQLDVLYSLSLSWSEKKGRVSDYQDVRLLQRKGVKRGMISIQFSDDIARYLLCSYVMQYPEALLSIDERSPRAYRVGYKLAYHSSVRRNIERGTADIISVSALLDACGDIPDFDEVQKTDRGHWENLCFFIYRLFCILRLCFFRRRIAATGRTASKRRWKPRWIAACAPACWTAGNTAARRRRSSPTARWISAITRRLSGCMSGFGWDG